MCSKNELQIILSEIAAMNLSASRYYEQRVLYYYTFYTEILLLRYKKYNDFCISERFA